MAAEILGVGLNRILIDPEKLTDVEAAIRREDVRKLINDGAISLRPERGISRGRARRVHLKKKAGRKRGAGSKEGAKGTRLGRKEKWINSIRAIRGHLKELHEGKSITSTTYRRLYRLAKGNAFRNTAHLDSYIKSSDLLRRKGR